MPNVASCLVDVDLCAIESLDCSQVVLAVSLPTAKRKTPAVEELAGTTVVQPLMKKARPKKTAAARSDDDDVPEKAVRQAEEELLEQKRRQQQLWEQSLGRCPEGHQFIAHVTGVDDSSCMYCGSSVTGVNLLLLLPLPVQEGRVVGLCAR